MPAGARQAASGKISSQQVAGPVRTFWVATSIPLRLYLSATKLLPKLEDGADPQTLERCVCPVPLAEDQGHRDARRDRARAWGQQGGLPRETGGGPDRS